MTESWAVPCILHLAGAALSMTSVPLRVTQGAVMLGAVVCAEMVHDALTRYGRLSSTCWQSGGSCQSSTSKLDAILPALADLGRQLVPRCSAQRIKTCATMPAQTAGVHGNTPNRILTSGRSGGCARAVHQTINFFHTWHSSTAMPQAACWLFVEVVASQGAEAPTR